jgi:uncharacterized membrane protein YuzA (DUF378 family)
MRFVDILAVALVLAGGLNSGMIAYCACDVIELTFGYRTGETRVAHAVIGAAAIYIVVASRWIVRRWKVSAEGLGKSFIVD